MWDLYFADKRDVKIDEQNVFRVYLSKAVEQNCPLIVLLHGGGYSGLTWSHFTVFYTIEHIECT